MPLFKLDKWQPFIDAVAPLRIAEYLEVVEDLLSGPVARCMNLMAIPFALQQLESALGDRVVAAIAAPAHTPHQIVRFEEVAPVLTAELLP